jgi:hypothetical protein
LFAVILKITDAMDRIFPRTLRLMPILIGCYVCGRAEIFHRFVNVRRSTV